MRFVKIGIILIVLVGCIGAGAMWLRGRTTAAATGFKTVPVTRGDLTVTINATGVLQPEEVIDIGAQVTGRIIQFGNDKAGKPIDYGSQVLQGKLLAQIDDSVYASQTAEAQAALDQAKAGVERATADVGQMRAKLEQAKRDWERAQKLGPSDALAQVDYDAYQSAYQVAAAQVAVGEASVAQSKTAVTQAEAALGRAKQNLGYCTINSPVDGVVIDRRVNIGQTVVSNLSASSLFLLAKDLRRMQVWAAVNEADIGSIKPKQDVTFTADAFPTRTFKGSVGKLRLNAQSTQNVVMYTVEITAENNDLTLLPYLTANVSFQVATREDVLMVPNTALRWSPSDPSMVAPDARDAFENGSGGRRSRGGGASGAAGGGNAAAGGAGAAGSPNATGTSNRQQPQQQQQSNATPSADGQPATRPSRDRSQRGTLWIQDGEFIRPIRVRLGVTDGTNTEIITDELKEGSQIVVGEGANNVAVDDAKNPFAPRFGGGGGRGGGGGGGGGRRG